MEHIIRLYSYIDGINDIPFPSEAEQVTITSFKYEANRMAGAPTITATVKHRLCLDDLWTDNVYGTFNGEKYFIRNVPSSSKSNDDTRYEHSVELLSEREILNHVYFIDAVQGDSTEDVYKTNTTKFQFMGNIHEFANRLNASLQYSNLDYSVVVDSGISSEDKLVSFEDKYILEAMQEIFNTYEIPYYFVGKVIHIGYTDNAITHVFKYGHDEALLKINKNNANYQVINRITAVGSSDNIPYYYPNESDDRAAIIASGKKWITPSQNLMPPIYRETNGAERFYNAKNNTYSDGEGGYYHFNNEYTPNNPLEGKQTFEDIKPTIKGMTNANGERIDMFMEFAYDRDDSDEVDEEGNYIHPYFFAKLRKTNGANGFNLFEHAIESQAMQISMTSGDCGACTFEIGVGEDTQQNIVQVDENGDLLRDDDGNVVRSGVPQPQQNDTENYEVWLALKKDDSTYSTLMPDALLKLRPSTNDTFVILGISLPQGYITRAEEELMKSMIKYMYMNNDEKFTFSIGFSRIFFTEHPDILSQLNENSRLVIEYNGKQHTLYVNSFNYNMSDSQPLPEIQIDLVDTLTVGQNSLQTALDSVKQDILTSMGGGDFLQNGLRYFLRKDIQDTARGKITFKKGLDVGNFSSNVSGGTFREDENGNTYIETDTLFVRKKAIFQEYQIKKVSYIGGEYICSAASMDSIFKVEEHDTFYRCYANDGSSSYENEFAVGDQAICRMSDLTQEHAVNRYYWRYVMAVGSNYVDLSKSDADKNSDIPAEGDILVQLGNRSDKTRQNAIIISSVSVDAPSLKLLRAINSYSLDNKDDISQGFDTSTGRGFLKIIGDFFAGAADNSTYVKYDAGRKVLEIKGKFLTGTGDSIEDIINNIQNQVDGAIETWFYEPVPTLNNEPAVNWTTENDKNNHLGDLYYSAEGKAYRFQKDGNNYVWKLIQDTDITKALEAANQARKEAEAARKEAQDAADRLNEWAADGVISPTEKQGIKDEIARIDADYTHINSEYTKYALGTPSAFNSAYTAYRAVLVTLSADTPETIDIPNDFATKQNKYYTERTNALDAISSKSVQLIEDAKAAANAAKDAAKNAQSTADGLKNFTDQAFSDGIVNRAEAAAIEKYLNSVKETQQSVNGTYNTLYGNAYLLKEDGTDTDEKKALKTAYDKLTSSINSLISIINSAIEDGIATSEEKAAVDTAYTTFNTNLNGYNIAVENANKAIQDRLKGYSDEYAYLKKAFENDTSIEGGVVATSLVQLGFKDSTGKYNIKSGINGIYDVEVLGNGISYWAGGLPIDREMYDEGSVPSNAATALIRMDGTGYLAGGNISWDANGKITTNKGAFYFGDELIDRYLDLFTLHVVNGNIDYITPNHPFSSIEVNTRIRIGNAYLEWDSANNGVKVYGIHGEEVGLYALGYISSLGLNDTTGGGGGSVDLLQDWNKYDSTTAKNMALSAYLGKDLLDRVISLENGTKGHTIVISGTGNVVTNVVEDGKTLTFTKGNIDTSITIDKITDLHSSWDSLLKAAPSAYVTRWPNISEIASKQNLVLKLNGGTTEGTNQFTYNVTAAKTVNITTSNIGADAKFITALGTNGNYLTWTKNGATNNITVPYASNADKLDGLHESSFVRIIGRDTIYTSDQAPYSYIHLFRIANNSGYSTLRVDVDVKTRYHAAILHIDITASEKPYGDGGSSVVISKQTCNGRSGNFYYKRTVQSSGYNYYDIYYKSGAWNSGSYGIIFKGYNGTLVYEPKGTNLESLPDGCTELAETLYPGNAASATQLQTAHTINGTSFNGTANITTAQWGTARNISISDATASNTGAAVSVNGGSNVTLKLPSTIAAALSGNATSATKLQTTRTLWGQSFNGTANVSGDMSSVGNINMNNNTTLKGIMAANDYWRIVGSGSSDAGSVAFETGDNGNEAIYFRQYNASGIAHSITLMDDSGNQSFLAVTASGMFTANGGITVPSSKTIKLGSGTISWDSTNGCFHFSHGLYSDEFVSALGLSASTGGGTGGDYNRLDNWSDYDTSKSTWALSAKLGYSLYQDVNSLKSGSALSFTTTGSGNVVSAISKSGTTVTVTKGITALTSHQAIYALTIQGNGTTIGTFNPKSAAATINITPANIGALTQSTADGLYVNVSGDTMSGDLLFSNSGTSTRQIRFQVGDNDYGRIAAGATAANAGWMEIATADDGNEPIYVRQYSGVFTTIKRTLTLLDGSGNSSFPGTVAAPTFSGNLNGTATNANFLKKNTTFNSTAQAGLQYYDADIQSTTNDNNWSAPSTGWHQIIHMPLSVSGYFTEIALPVNDVNGLAWRQRRSGSYYGWYRILDTNNYASTLDGRYIKKAGDTMTGALNFANYTWNKVGDDVYMGDHNQANYFCLKANSGTTVGINFYNSSDGDLGKLASANGTLQWKSNTVWHAGNDGSGSGLDADLLDGWHGIGTNGNVLRKSGYVTSGTSGLSNYWCKLASFTWNSQYNDQDITLYLHSAYNSTRGIVHLRARWSSTTSYNIECKILAGDLNASNIRLYYDPSSTGATNELWYNTGGQYAVINAVVLSETNRTSTEIGRITLYSTVFSSAQTLPSKSYINASYISISNNASTATKLQTARQINGTNFDGSANITTAKWGNSRTLTLGSYLSGSVTTDGSANVTLNANVLGLTSQGGKTAISGTTMPAEGLRLYNVYNNGYPCTYGNLISVKGQGAGELLLEWTGSSALGHIRYRSKRDNNQNGWSDWGTVAFQTDNVASATKLQTARTLWGQSFNGTANVSGSMTGVGSITMSGAIVQHGGENHLSYDTYSDPASGINCALKIGGSDSTKNHLAVGSNIYIDYNKQSTDIGLYIYGTNYLNGEAIYISKGICAISSTIVYFVNTVTCKSDLSAAGAITALSTSSSSDERLKKILGAVDLTTEQIAEAPSVAFKWRKNGDRAVGTIAQYWQDILPEVVGKDNNGYLTMQYGVAAMLASISNAKRILSVEERIKQLEDEITRLKAGMAA